MENLVQGQEVGLHPQIGPHPITQTGQGQGFHLVSCLFIRAHIMRKPAFCICENKGTDLLRGNRKG